MTLQDLRIESKGTPGVLGAFLAWMGWISLVSYQALNLDKVNEVLHHRIFSTNKELVHESEWAIKRSVMTLSVLILILGSCVMARKAEKERDSHEPWNW